MLFIYSLLQDIWDDASDGTLNVGRSTPDRNRRSKMNKSVGSVGDSSVKRFNSLTVVSKFSPKSRQGSVMNWLNKNS